jgi:hypothetical protein
VGDGVETERQTGEGEGKQRLPRHPTRSSDGECLGHSVGEDSEAQVVVGPGRRAVAMSG